MTTHEVLVAARNLIDREGWTQGSYHNRDGYCVEGACGQAASGDPRLPAFEALHVLDRVSSSDMVSVWNDAAGRTKDEVLALFDEAIAATAPEPFVELDVPVEVTVSA